MLLRLRASKVRGLCSVGEADGSLGSDNPQKYGGAQAEMWHGADGHPLIERDPTESRIVFFTAISKRL
jgi:hypothetical protein